MSRVLAILSCAALITTAAMLPGNAQQPPKWADRKSATPGVQFTLKETNREPYNGATRVIYQLVLAGAPEDQTYQVFFVWADFTVNQMGWQAGGEPAGVILCQGPSAHCPALRAADINGKTFGIYGYTKGEALRLIVTSVDQTIKAFAEVFPFPLEARDGPCHLWAELVPGAQGKTFAFYGDGFPAGAKVLTSSHSGHEVLNRTFTILDDGSLPPVIISPAVVGQMSGEASFTAIGPACTPTVTYQWGRPALTEQ